MEQSNLLLASLSPPCRDLLMARTMAIPLPLRTPLYEADEAPGFCYFITSGFASVVTSMSNGGTAEVAVIGREGVVGAVHLLGPAPVQTNCFMQMEGTALRIRSADLQRALSTSEEIRSRLLEFMQQEVLNISQVAGCNRLHEAEERMARWLLMVQDRIQSDVLNITQEFLAQMLGARRTTVTMVAGGLQQRGLIEYQRGRVKIVDRPALEAAACDCYPILNRLYHGLYKHQTPGQRFDRLHDNGGARHI